MLEENGEDYLYGEYFNQIAKTQEVTTEILGRKYNLPTKLSFKEKVQRIYTADKMIFYRVNADIKEILDGSNIIKKVYFQTLVKLHLNDQRCVSKISVDFSNYPNIYKELKRLSLLKFWSKLPQASQYIKDNARDIEKYVL